MEKRARLDQIVAWLAGSLDQDDRHAFDGVIVFDEAYAMANAAGSKGNRREVKPSQQGWAGLRLQNALADRRTIRSSWHAPCETDRAPPSRTRLNCASCPHPRAPSTKTGCFAPAWPANLIAFLAGVEYSFERRQHGVSKGESRPKPH